MRAAKVLAVTLAAIAVVLGASGVAHAAKPGPGTAGAWEAYGDRAGGAVEALDTGLAQVRAASRTGSRATIVAACESFGVDAAAAAGVVDRSPSKAVNRMTREALYAYAQAVQLCARGDYAASGDAIARGNLLFAQARDRVDVIRERFA